jgi:2-oxoglutarate ferredoxin oxidoreductase subunit beta
MTSAIANATRSAVGVDLGLSAMADVPRTDVPQKAKDFASAQEVRWCPGCGDYVILATVKSVLPQLGLRRENIVFVSGIGCSSRFPYYLETYGVHSIHGRAPTLATGLAITRPDLSVWVVTGDGDSLSIGGNHLIHALRRNVNMRILMFNNRIYGLTKGQYSPTSEVGKVTKSTPMGSIDVPFNTLSLAIGAEAAFVGRALDSDRAGLTEVLLGAANHRGAAFVEILQDCPIFNDGSFDALRKDGSQSRLIHVRHGEPIIFGADGELCVIRRGFGLQVARTVDVSTDDIVVHDAYTDDPEYAYALSRLSDQGLQYTVLGIVRSVARPTYDDAARAQVARAKETTPADLQQVINGHNTWTVAPSERRTVLHSTNPQLSVQKPHEPDARALRSH